MTKHTRPPATADEMHSHAWAVIRRMTVDGSGWENIAAVLRRLRLPFDERALYAYVIKGVDHGEVDALTVQPKLGNRVSGR